MPISPCPRPASTGGRRGEPPSSTISSRAVSASTRTRIRTSALSPACLAAFASPTWASRSTVSPHTESSPVTA
ncbi:hypothetical protein ACIBI9_10250 [Nonomuraea sp. NPDC050451]|uniref:hypothetical protein n=1 Tax=Nonomuraea sp. NPDC050451 TaxID=3364364 RepID=UPI0037A3D8E4